MRPPFQERFQVYVMGPTQDVRLANIAAGQSVPKINLTIDLEAPFVLRRRALGPVSGGNPLAFLKTRWTGPTQDYRQGDLMVLESLQQPYFGLNGSPSPVSPEITYPPGGTLSLDLVNTGASPLENVTFYWIGVNRYPWGVLPAPSYPSEFRGSNFAQPFLTPALTAPDVQLRLPFKCKPDGDFVIRGGQAGTIGYRTGCPSVFTSGVLVNTLETISVVLRDYNGMPYMNDWVDINILFGTSLAADFGTGPGHPGIIYPEIYLPENRQLLIDVQQTAAGTAGASLLINFIGAKVFKGAREQ